MLIHLYRDKPINGFTITSQLPERTRIIITPAPLVHTGAPLPIHAAAQFRTRCMLPLRERELFLFFQEPASAQGLLHWLLLQYLLMQTSNGFATTSKSKEQTVINMLLPVPVFTHVKSIQLN